MEGRGGERRGGEGLRLVLSRYGVPEWLIRPWLEDTGSALPIALLR